MTKRKTAASAVKQRVTIWADAATVRRLSDIATENHLSVSEAGAEILRQALIQRSAELSADLLAPRLEQELHQAIGRMSDRFAAVLVKTAVESAATRRLVLQLLIRNVGVDEARQLNEACWQAGITTFKKPAIELLELLGLTSVQPKDGGGRCGS